MEKIKFVYKYSDEDENKTINICSENEDGIHDYEVCEMFVDFMRSVGFSEENVYRFFKDY